MPKLMFFFSCQCLGGVHIYLSKFIFLPFFSQSSANTGNSFHLTYLLSEKNCYNFLLEPCYRLSKMQQKICHKYFNFRTMRLILILSSHLHIYLGPAFSYKLYPKLLYLNIILMLCIFHFDKTI